MITPTEFESPYYNLKSLIERKGMTQVEVAENLGMDRTTFNLKINRSNGRDFTFQEAIIKVDLRNLKKLIKQAKEQADQLQKTLDEINKTKIIIS